MPLPNYAPSNGYAKNTNYVEWVRPYRAHAELIIGIRGQTNMTICPPYILNYSKLLINSGDYTDQIQADLHAALKDFLILPLSVDIYVFDNTI